MCSAVVSRRSSALWSEKTGFRTPQVEKTLDAPDDAARIQIERNPVAFRLDGNVADEHDWANGVFVGDNVPVGIDEDRGRSHFGQNFPRQHFHT